MKKISVRKVVLGEGKAKICVPIMGADINEIISQAEEVKAMAPDLVEWRCDFLDSPTRKNVENVLTKLRSIMGEIPIIFTVRTHLEGGNIHISDREYYELNVMAAKTGKVDIVDVEAYTKGHIASELIRELHDNGVKVIASNHDFYNTMSEAVIYSILSSMEKYGPDMCKMAVMPNEKSDVDVLIRASARAAKDLSVPIITMSMGELGSVTRVCTGDTGSAITFAAGVKASAPGQISCEELREVIELSENISRDRNLMLIGFMGTGKSTISSALSKITGLKEIDVDKYIVEKTGMSIPEIFDKYGENGFRDIETQSLRELQQNKGYIISCGGGAVLRDENVRIMKDGGVIILLTASPEVVFDRVKDNTDRPILNADMSLEHVKRLMEARRERYENAAQVTVNTDHSDRVKTCHDILKKVSLMK